MDSQIFKSRPYLLLLIPLVLALIIGIDFTSEGETSLSGYVSGFFGELLGGKSSWEKALIASLLIGVGNALFIPISVLLLATALFMPGWPAFGACMLGSLLAAALGFWFGLFVDDSFLKRKLGKKYELAVSEINKDGLKALVLLHFAPIAPNLLVNIMAGVCRIRFWKVMLGTAIGFLPGVTVLTLLGREIRRMVEEPGPQTAVAIVAIAGLIFLIYKISKRVQAKLGEKESI